MWKIQCTFPLLNKGRLLKSYLQIWNCRSTLNGTKDYTQSVTTMLKHWNAVTVVEQSKNIYWTLFTASLMLMNTHLDQLQRRYAEVILVNLEHLSEEFMYCKSNNLQGFVSTLFQFKCSDVIIALFPPAWAALNIKQNDHKRWNAQWWLNRFSQFIPQQTNARRQCGWVVRAPRFKSCSGSASLANSQLARHLPVENTFLFIELFVLSICSPSIALC